MEEQTELYDEIASHCAVVDILVKIISKCPVMLPGIKLLFFF